MTVSGLLATQTDALMFTKLQDLSCNVLKQHKKTIRWVVFLLLLCAFFFWLGTVAKPVNGAGFCKVFY